jgi:hypothetical protein
MSAQGQFLGRFVVELITDDKDGLWDHQEPFGFRAADGAEYWAKRGHRTDFCSVPRVPLAYEMLGNRARKAGSIHDMLYGPDRPAGMTREKADALLREMLVLDGVGQCEAEQFYLAVRMFGGSHYTAAAQAEAA